MSTIYPALTQGYARAIYKDGTRTFQTILPDYVAPTKQYAATNYTLPVIDGALGKGYITQDEYADTLALVTQS